MSEKIKACWFCRHFDYMMADAGYSEYTPGHEFMMSCGKNRWTFDAFTTGQDEFGAMLSSANTCPDYEEQK